MSDSERIHIEAEQKLAKELPGGTGFQWDALHNSGGNYMWSLFATDRHGGTVYIYYHETEEWDTIPNPEGKELSGILDDIYNWEFKYDSPYKEDFKPDNAFGHLFGEMETKILKGDSGEFYTCAQVPKKFWDGLGEANKHEKDGIKFFKLEGEEMTGLYPITTKENQS